MKLIWHGHSCFSLHTVQGSLVIDPFADHYVPGCGVVRTTADAVFCSHGHSDHNAKEVVDLTGAPCGISVETVDSWHDEVQGAKRGPNTIHIFSAEGMKVVHLGDLGCELDETQTAALKGCDVLLIPIGGFYTIDPTQAKEIVDQLSPRIVVPMHYRGDGFGYDVLATVEDFLALCGKATRLDTNELTITADTPAGIYVPAHPSH